AAARAAQAGGADWLAVATAEEARELRAAGLGGTLLVLGALSETDLPVALEAEAEVVAWREAFLDGVAAAGGTVGVHVKLDTGMGTLPIGYADGVRRGLTNNADVLIAGRRFPLVGTVSMDNVTVDLGPDGGGVCRGDEAILIGAQDGDRILAEDVARRLDTI